MSRSTYSATRNESAHPPGSHHSAAGAPARVARRRPAERLRRGPRLRARVRDPLRRCGLFREAPEPVVRGADDQADQSYERDVAAFVVAHLGQPLRSASHNITHCVPSFS